MGNGGITFYGATGLTKEQKKSSEDLYNFVRDALIALQPTNGFGESDFTCPLCGGHAHVRRVKGEIYNNGHIECECGYSFHF